MLIVNPITGNTTQSVWYDGIESTNNPDFIKVCCNLFVNGNGQTYYKDPLTYQEKTINPLDVNTRQIYVITDKHIFYKHIFGNAYQAPFDNDPTPVPTSYVLKSTNTMKKNDYSNIIDNIFKDYPYGKPLFINCVKKKKVRQTVSNDLAIVEDEYDDYIYMSAPEIDERLDDGSIYTDEDGEYRDADTDIIVRVRTNNIRLRNNRPNRNIYRWDDANGYYWPIKNIDVGFHGIMDMPGYAVYKITGDDNEYKQVYTKNFNDLQVNNINDKNLIDVIIKHCKVIITDTAESTQVFGRKIVKRRMMLNDKNIKGYEIADIIPNYNCVKDGVTRDVVVIKGDINYKFVMSDVKIVFPFANTILKGIIPSKDKTFKAGRKAKIINDKHLKISKGEIVTIVSVEGNHYANSDINYIQVITVADKGGNRFKMWSNHLKVL